MFTHFSCDVLACDRRTEVATNGGFFAETPTRWGRIDVSKIRGHSDVVMWLCPDHFKVIDDWKYDS